MKIGLALRELHRSEDDLGHELLQVADRHRVDHEIFHVAQDLARWSQQHVREIAAVAGRYGEDLDPEPHGMPSLAKRALERSAELVGRTSTADLLLLRDLRGLYLKAAGVSVDWELVAQAAQGIRHTDLLGLAQRCHPETVRQMKWANGKLKESATQALVS
ncbi:hypothetical protein GC089_14620 [Cellulomonas sp. JZ18]|uniref:hypothetical protein n=1 Tax=Cellulomonas sp. JZ18 TaxID=2654191 RepID=UPI0012D3D824|nr:hypothetical protein [Cellulomonas sp. JZ18]QGQ20208.1 hypothetical protein GC089_14620 [Cellulomonas sp. JZ18]